MKLRGLYAITDSQLLAGRFLSHVEAALEGGVCLLQYRDKSDDAARRLREAEGLMKLCERYGTQLLINDDAELAARFHGVAGQLADNETTIVDELLQVQGVAMDIGGYYLPDDAQAEAAMRPSATMNRIIDGM